MPIWTRDPPDDASPYVFRIVRTPAASPIVGIITCDEAVGCSTHFVHHRTVPCEGPRTCPHCNEGHSWRWHGYVSAMLTPSLEHVLFEFTATASDAFKNYRLLHQRLRACRFRAYRPSKRNNGRVVIQTSPGDPNLVRLPDPPDIRRLLCHIWNVQYELDQPTRMARPPFQSVALPETDDDGRYHSP